MTAADPLQRRADEIYAAERDEDGCPGHPAGPDDPMGETIYCDGSCVVPPREGAPRCPSCGRVMSNREAAEQGACNDCHPGGAYDPHGGEEGRGF